MVIACIINMTLLPVIIAFLDYYDWWTHCLIFNIVFDTIFAADMVYNFRTGESASREDEFQPLNGA